MVKHNSGGHYPPNKLKLEKNSGEHYPPNKLKLEKARKRSFGLSSVVWGTSFSKRHAYEINSCIPLIGRWNCGRSGSQAIFLLGGGKVV